MEFYSPWKLFALEVSYAKSLVTAAKSLFVHDATTQQK